VSELLLGLDAGLTLTKAVVFRPDGTPVGAGQVPSQQHSPHEGWVEKDLDDLWAGACRAIAEALAAAGVAGREIAAVGPTGHGDGLLLLDAEHRPARPAILSLDGRAGGVLARLHRDGVPARALDLVGEAPFAVEPPVLLAWVKEHEPDVYRRIGHVLFCKDWLKFRLTGRLTTDPTDASAGFTDVHSQGYAPGALALFGLDELEGTLPELVRSQEVAGEVTADAAAATGLAPGTPVVSGLHDCDASAAGCGGVRPGQLTMIAGTFSINETISDGPVGDERLLCRNWVEPGQWMTMANSAASATNLEWFVGKLAPLEAERAAAAGSSPFAFAGDEVAATLGDPSRVLYLPFLYRSPYLSVPLVCGGEEWDDTLDVEDERVRPCLGRLAGPHDLDADIEEMDQPATVDERHRSCPCCEFLESDDPPPGLCRVGLGDLDGAAFPPESCQVGLDAGGCRLQRVRVQAAGQPGGVGAFQRALEFLDAAVEQARVDPAVVDTFRPPAGQVRDPLRLLKDPDDLVPHQPVDVIGGEDGAVARLPWSAPIPGAPVGPPVTVGPVPAPVRPPTRGRHPPAQQVGPVRPSRLGDGLGQDPLDPVERGLVQDRRGGHVDPAAELAAGAVAAPGTFRPVLLLFRERQPADEGGVGQDPAEAFPIPPGGFAGVVPVGVERVGAFGEGLAVLKEEGDGGGDDLHLGRVVFQFRGLSHPDDAEPERWRAARPSTLCCFAALPGDHPVQDHCPFELSERAELLKRQPSDRGGRVDRPVGRDDRDAIPGKLRLDVEQVPQVPRQPVDLGEHDRLDRAGTGRGHDLHQLRPVACRAGEHVGGGVVQNPIPLGDLRPPLCELVGQGGLVVVCLFGGGDAGHDHRVDRPVRLLGGLLVHGVSSFTPPAAPEPAGTAGGWSRSGQVMMPVGSDTFFGAALMWAYRGANRMSQAAWSLIPPSTNWP
jgi:L-xylulokinase